MSFTVSFNYEKQSAKNIASQLVSREKCVGDKKCLKSRGLRKNDIHEEIDHATQANAIFSLT